MVELKKLNNNDWDLDKTIPTTEENGETIRTQSPIGEDFDLNATRPISTWTSDIATMVKALPKGIALAGTSRPEKIAEMIKEEERLATLRTLGRTVQIIRWPFWRYIEHPVSTIVVALQEPEGKTIGETLAKATQTYIPFRQIPPEEYGNYGQIWRNYYKSITNTEPPDWYLAMASYGTAVGVEIPAIRGIEKAGELALTRVAKPYEVDIIRKAFEPLKISLERRGIDTTKLYVEGNIIRLSENSELYMNKYLSAVLRGDQIRIPRWAKIEAMPVVSKIVKPAEKALIVGKAEILPVTGKEVIITPQMMAVMPKVEKIIKPKITLTPEKFKPDISGITPLQKQIQEMADRQARVEIAKDVLQEIDTVRQFFKHSITKYRGEYLKEELKDIPSFYITREGGISPDEAMDELRNKFNIEIADETELKEYLVNLEQSRKDLIAEIKTYRPEFITKKETTLLAEKIKATEQGLREGRIQTKAEISKTQTELIEMIEESGLEPEDRAKFLRLVKNIQTRSQLESKISEIKDRIISLREHAERSEVVSDLRDLFERQPTKDLPLEYKDLIEEIKDKIVLKKKIPKTTRRLESMRQFVERMAEQGEEINIPEEKLALLEKHYIDEFTTDELKDLKETVQRFYHLGRLKNKLLTTQQEREFEDIKNQIVDTITKGKGLSEESTIIKTLREQNKNFIKADIEHIKNYIIENMRPELMILIFDDFNTEGILTQTLWNPLWESQKAELTESDRVLKLIKETHKNLNLAEIFTKRYDIGRFKGMTKLNAMFIYAKSFNESDLLHLYGSGITDEDITAIKDFLSADEKKAVEDMFRFYNDDQWVKLDEIYSELEGVHLGKEDPYFPTDRLEDITYNKELEKEILERYYVRRAGVSKGFTKERVASTKGFFEFDYFGTILRNMRKVEHYKAFAKAIRDANKILSNPEIKQAIKQKYGDKYYQILEKWLKDIAYGGDRQYLASIDKISRWLRTNYTTAVIGGNLVSVMKAPISFLQGMEMAGKWNVIKATLKFLLSPLDWNKEIDTKSVLMKFRPMRQERELGEIVQQRKLIQQIGKVTGYQFIKEGGLLPWVIADKTTCDIVWLGAYDSAIADGLSEQKAVDYADMIIRRTQPMSGMLNLPDTFRGPEYQKFFTLFRNQPNQNFNLLLESILRKQKGKISNTEFMSHLVFYLLVPAVMIGVISRKRIPEDIGEFAKDILNGTLGGLIYIGNITNLITMGFMGATTPLDSLYEDVYKTVQTKDNWKKLGHFAMMISKLIGFPLLGIKRIITGKPLGEKAKKKRKGYYR